FLRQEYGQRGANGFGAVIVVADRNLEGIVLRMVPAGVIKGAISSTFADRLAGVSIQAYRLRRAWNGRRLEAVQNVATNDLGEYKLFGLNGGQYYVAATYNEPARSTLASTGIRFTPNLSKADGGFATFYFPGVTAPAQAQPIRITPGLDPGNV